MTPSPIICALCGWSPDKADREGCRASCRWVPRRRRDAWVWRAALVVFVVANVLGWTGLAWLAWWAFRG